MSGPVGRQLTLYWSINFIPYNYNVSVILSILCKCIYVMKLKRNLLLLLHKYHDCHHCGCLPLTLTSYLDDVHNLDAYSKLYQYLYIYIKYWNHFLKTVLFQKSELVYKSEMYHPFDVRGMCCDLYLVLGMLCNV